MGTRNNTKEIKKRMLLGCDIALGEPLQSWGGFNFGIFSYAHFIDTKCRKVYKSVKKSNKNSVKIQSVAIL